MHPLDGCFAKMARADESIQVLDAEISSFLKSGVYRIVGQRDPDARQYRLVAVGPPPPLRFSVLAGEIIHHLRSSLDHLVWQLVLANGGTPDRRTEFPISETLSQYKDACGRGKIAGVSKSAAAIIKALQPYHRGARFQHHPLWVLHEMDRIDKHRLLVTVAVGVRTGNELRIGSEPGGEGVIEITNFVPAEGFIRPSEGGTEVARLTFASDPSDVTASMDCTFHVAFEKRGMDAHQSVIPGLVELSDRITKTLARFQAEFPPRGDQAAPPAPRGSVT